jgi:hypothetical protein
MRIWIRNTAFFLFSLRICDLRTRTPPKFADLRLRNEPKNLQIWDLRINIKICVPTFGIYKVFVSNFALCYFGDDHEGNTEGKN